MVIDNRIDGAVKLPWQLFGEENDTCIAQDVTQLAKEGMDMVRIFKELKKSITW